jgi:hypothetical protein
VSEAPSQTEEKKLVSNIEELVSKLEKLPDNEELRKLVIHMNSVAKDIKVVVENSFDVKRDFDQFVLKIHWSYGLRVYSPESKTEIAYIENDCIEQKGFYNCLMEKFSNKIPILNKLLEEFSLTLEKYTETITNIIVGDEEDDP